MSKIEIPMAQEEQKAFDPKEENLKILRQFCAPNDTRYVLNHPFFVGDFVYASDTHIIVRMPKDLVPDNFERPEGNLPRVDGVLSDEELRHADYTLPMMVSNELTTECGNCNGSGKIDDLHNEKICPECMGEGVTECRSCSSTHSCDTCGGRGILIGKRECDDCKGSGREHVIMLGDVPFSMRYARKVQELFGQAEWGLSQNRERAMFRAGQIDGCYMRVQKRGHK